MYVQITYSAKLDDVPDSVIEQIDKLLKVVEQKRASLESFKKDVKDRRFLDDAESLQEIKVELDRIISLSQDFDLYLQNIVGVVSGLADAQLSADDLSNKEGLDV